MADYEILANLLGDEKTDRSTTEIVEYVACKEQAKAEHGTVCGEAPIAAAVTPKRGAYSYSEICKLQDTLGFAPRTVLETDLCSGQNVEVGEIMCNPPIQSNLSTGS